MQLGMQRITVKIHYIKRIVLNLPNIVEKILAMYCIQNNQRFKKNT